MRVSPGQYGGRWRLGIHDCDLTDGFAVPYGTGTAIILPQFLKYGVMSGSIFFLVPELTGDERI
jgi:hypothetical protein